MTVRTKRQTTSAVGSSVTAAQDLVAEMQRDGFAMVDGFAPREGHIYVRTRAISARINQNFDGFPSEELRKAYKTFLGKPVFVNHANSDTKRARGRVVAAAYLERGDDKFIDTFMEVNARKFPRLAHEIRTGGIDAVSMGCEAQRTVCSYCNNEASGLHDMCEHVLYHKGQQLPFSDQITGAVEDRLVYESCYDLGFFELSFVFDPADETALASKVLVASRRTPNRMYCDLPGCRRWTNIGGENSQEWVQRNGEGRTYDYCCNGHREQYENQYPNWLKDATIRNPIKKRAFGETEAPPPVDTLRDESQDGDEFHRYVEPPPELDDPDLDKAQELDRREDEPGAIGNDIPSEDIDMAPRPTGQPERRPQPVARRKTAGDLGWRQDPESDGSPMYVADVPDADIAVFQQGDLWEWEIIDPNTGDYIDTGTADSAGVAQLDAEDAYASRFGTGNFPGNNPEYWASRKDTNMGKPSLADRGRVASRGRLRHADQSRNDQGEQEEVFITQTPPAEPVETADGEEISNTEQNLVAKAREGRAAEARLRRLRARRKQAEETADVVNPEQSGTDTDLKGDFESADPNDGVQETQPKDAARRTANLRRAFRRWVAETQGTRVASAPNRAQLLRWAATFARENGLDVKAMYPVVRAEAEAIVARRKKAADDEGVSGGQADKDAVEEFIKDPGDAEDKKESRRRKQAADDDKPDFLKDDDDDTDSDDTKESKRKTADEKLDVAAPDGRVDVERPTQNTTDDEAQASQFDKGDFGDNAGDDLADPDLSTDQNWAPGEGKRSHRVVQKAGGIQAMRLAEAFVTAGLDDKNKGRYTLAAEFEQMSAGVVADRIQLLEKVIQANGLGQRQERRTAGVRGGGVKSAVPQNFTARQQAASPQQRHSAAGEIGNPDSDIFFS